MAAWHQLAVRMQTARPPPTQTPCRHQQHGDAITLPANADVLAAAAAAVPGVDLFPAFPAELLAGVTVGGARLRQVQPGQGGFHG